MSDKFVYQNARIKAIETRLLSQQQQQRLLDASNVSEVFKLLVEMGFGQGVAVENGDFDKVFEAEEHFASSVLRQFNVDGELDAFLLLNDYHNLKALLKASVMGEESPYLMAEGIFEIEKIKAAIVGEISDLPQEMTQIISKINKLISESKATPRVIDTMVDKASYRAALNSIKRNAKLIKQYFSAKIDYLNILSFFRCKRSEQSQKFFLEALIDGGELSEDFFASAYESPNEVFKEKCKFTPYRDLVAKAVDDNNLIAFEVAIDNALLKLWRENFNDMFSPAPILYYYFEKLTEIKVIKLIVAGVKNHVEPSLIKERMREIYGA